MAYDIEALRAALLDTIAGTEAPDYRTMYGGRKFDSYEDHPRVAVPIRSGPNTGKTSSAAGRYQFLGSTWDQYRDKLGLTDFSPASQDRAAIALAADAYRAKTGGSLDDALASGDPNILANVGRSLAGTWTSLPGGIEQGQGANRFVSSFQRHLNGGASPVTGASGAMVASAPAPSLPSASPQAPVAPQQTAAMPIPDAQPEQSGMSRIVQALLQQNMQEEAPMQLPQIQFGAPQGPTLAQYLSALQGAG